MNRQKKKEEINQQECDKAKIEIIGIRNNLNVLDSKLNILLGDIDKNNPTTTAEVINVLHGIHRDLIIAKENIQRINRILFKNNID